MRVVQHVLLEAVGPDQVPISPGPEEHSHQDGPDDVRNQSVRRFPHCLENPGEGNFLPLCQPVFKISVKSLLQHNDLLAGVSGIVPGTVVAPGEGKKPVRRPIGIGDTVPERDPLPIISVTDAESGRVDPVEKLIQIHRIRRNGIRFADVPQHPVEKVLKRVEGKAIRVFPVINRHRIGNQPVRPRPECFVRPVEIFPAFLIFFAARLIEGGHVEGVFFVAFLYHRSGRRIDHGDPAPRHAEQGFVDARFLTGVGKGKHKGLKIFLELQPFLDAALRPVDLLLPDTRVEEIVSCNDPLVDVHQPCKPEIGPDGGGRQTGKLHRRQPL